MFFFCCRCLTAICILVRLGQFATAQGTDETQGLRPSLIKAPFDEKTAKAGQNEWAKFLGYDVTEKNRVGMKLNLIPPGEYLMGGDQSAEEVARLAGGKTDAGYFTDEHPQHQVRILKPFYLGMHEVNQSEWESVMGSNPSYFAKSGFGKELVGNLDTSQFPVELVSWYDSVEFCNKLSQRERLALYYRMTDIERKSASITKATVSVSGGNGYRLPTEAEWEFACRAGTTTPFHFGKSSNGEAANIDGKQPYGTTTQGPFLGRTTIVGTYKSNSFGLFDMHGNVSEWCFDGYDNHAYQNRLTPANDPVNTNVFENRVERGGCWGNAAWITRSADRSEYYSDHRRNLIGFRVARTP